MAKSACKACNETFTSLSAFDKHQTQRGDKVRCKDPAKIGLERRSNGLWGFPRTQGQGEIPKAAQATWEASCARCEARFTKPPGRGRPPTKCQACGGKGILI